MNLLTTERIELQNRKNYFSFLPQLTFGKFPNVPSGPMTTHSERNKPNEYINENIIVTTISTAILKKNPNWQRNMKLPEPAVVIAPAMTVEPIFVAECLNLSSLVW